MENDRSAAIAEIVRDLRQLEQPLRNKCWEPLMAYVSEAAVTIKGTPRDTVYLAKFLALWTAAIQDVEVVLEEVLERHIEPDRIEWNLRVAALGRRIEGGAPDGVIMDCRAAFELRGSRWRPRELCIDCPPEWAQWNNRPNSRAPIHYGDPSWRAGRGSGDVTRTDT